MNKNLFFDCLGLRLEIPQTPTDEIVFIENLSDFLGGNIKYMPKGMTGYPLHARIELENSVMIVRYGAVTHNMTLHVEAKGESAELLKSFILFHPAIIWHCTRADIAYDFTVNKDFVDLDMTQYPDSLPVKPRSNKDAFWFVHERILQVAKQKNISTSPAGAWHMSEGGRTLYVGSKGGGVQSLYRLYEKSEERWAAGYRDYPADVIRFEWQYRMKNRIAITELEPYSIIATNRTAIHFFELLTDSAIEYKKTEAHARAGADLSYLNMLNQYKNVLRETEKSKGRIWMLRQLVGIVGTS